MGPDYNIPRDIAVHNEQRNVVTVHGTSTHPRYEGLDIINLIQCLSCSNYADITSEPFNKATLDFYMKRMRSLDPDPDFICSHCKECIALKKKVDANIKKFNIEKLNNDAVIINKRLEEYKSTINSLKEQLVAIKKELASYKAKPSTYEKGSSFKLENRINDGAVQNDNPIRPTYLIEAGKQMSLSEFTEKLPVRVVPNHTRRMRLVCIGVPKHMDDRTFIQELSEELNLKLDNSKIKKDI